MASSWDSPLQGYENAEPLPTTTTEGRNGNSILHNLPPQTKSVAYDKFPIPINSNGFDFHIYYMQNVKSQAKFAKQLHERVRREFPELLIYAIHEGPAGPHPVANFEIDTVNPHQTGVLFSWLVVHRGPCSVLIHPNTGDNLKDHGELATWMGKPWPLYEDILKKHVASVPVNSEQV